MAVFKSEKFKSLRVSGAGKFKDGVLEVDGDSAKKVRRLVGDEAFGVTEEKATARSAKATGAKAKDDADADPDATKKDDATTGDTNK